MLDLGLWDLVRLGCWGSTEHVAFQGARDGANRLNSDSRTEGKVDKVQNKRPNRFWLSGYHLLSATEALTGARHLENPRRMRTLTPTATRSAEVGHFQRQGLRHQVQPLRWTQILPCLGVL